MVQQKPGILIVDDEKMVCDILLHTGSLEACICVETAFSAHARGLRRISLKMQKDNLTTQASGRAGWQTDGDYQSLLARWAEGKLR